MGWTEQLQGVDELGSDFCRSATNTNEELELVSLACHRVFTVFYWFTCLFQVGEV